MTRIAEGDDRCGATPAAGVALLGMEFFGAPLKGPTAPGECAGWEFVGGGAFRAISPVEPLLSMGDRLATAEDGPVGFARLAVSAGRALRD